MKVIRNNRFDRAAARIATRLESEPEIHLVITSYRVDGIIYRITCYLSHYYGQYDIVYTDNTVIIRKQG